MRNEKLGDLRRAAQRRNYNIPPYTPSKTHWTMTFAALRWDRSLVERFWAVFCRINTSLAGKISRAEFFTYFDLVQTPHANRCFSYFDTTGDNTVDFLEFMVSIWNVCTMKVDALTNFAFDLFSDCDGELSFPEIEHIIEELYGKDGVKSGTGKKAMDDITVFARERGGCLRLADFTIITATHQLILFPIFQIQRTIQSKVMGERYWLKVEREQPISSNDSDHNTFDPRHVHMLLRTHKARGAAALHAHAGDANQGLREWFEKKNHELPFIQQTDVERTANKKRKIGWKRVKALLKRDGERQEQPQPMVNTAVEAFVTSGRRRAARNVIAERAMSTAIRRMKGGRVRR